MIVSRTPFRISFFGGGTDYPEWYNLHQGKVISATINKYCFVTIRDLPPFFTYKYRIRYYQREEINNLEDIMHPSVRETLRSLNISNGVEIVHHADLPARSGLGSSSTFTVSMLHAAHALKYQMPTKYQLAIEAIKLEQETIGEVVGSQDQTAAAFGGVNRIDFGGPNCVTVVPLIIPPERLKLLESHLMLFFTGFSRTASEIACEQVSTISSKEKELFHMIDIVDEAEKILLNGEISILEFGRLLDEQWKLKKKMSSKITTDAIDEIYDSGCNSGALGGKLLGAGGGGFILFFVEPKNKEKLKDAMNNLLYVPFNFEFSGSQIIYHGNHA